MHDGLSLREMCVLPNPQLPTLTEPHRHPLHNRLRNGRTRETRSEIPNGTPVRPLPSPSFPALTPYRRVARDPRFERLPCAHKGTYADDCLVQRVTTNNCYIVGTCDRELRRRIRKVPGVPLMHIVKRKYSIERLPDQGAPS